MKPLTFWDRLGRAGVSLVGCFPGFSDGVLSLAAGHNLELRRFDDIRLGIEQLGVERVERFAFYERAKQAFGVVATGERALYGNLILKKGVIG